MYNTSFNHTPGGSSLDQIRRLGANYGLNNDPTPQAFRGYNYDSYSTDFEYLRIKSDLGDGWGARRPARRRECAPPGQPPALAGLRQERQVRAASQQPALAFRPAWMATRPSIGAGVAGAGPVGATAVSSAGAAIGMEGSPCGAAPAAGTGKSGAASGRATTTTSIAGTCGGGSVVAPYANAPKAATPAACSAIADASANVGILRGAGPERARDRC
jgi:hypothetical protein